MPVPSPRSLGSSYVATTRAAKARRRAWLCAAVVAWSIGSTSEAQAQEYRPPEYGYSYGEHEGPRTLAVGGAGRAWGWSTSALPLNPANLVAQNLYHFEGMFSADTRAHRLTYGGAIIDSVTSPVALGVQGIKSDLGNGDPYRRSTIDVRVGAGYKLAERLSFGATGHYLRATQDGTGPLGGSAVSRGDGDSNYRQVTFDAGLVLSASEAVRIGMVGYNLTATQSPLMPLMVGGGVGIKVSDLTLEADVVGVDKVYWGAWKARIQGGLEWLVGDHYPLRLGYSYDQGSGRHAISGGLGYVDRQFAIDAGMRAEVGSPADPYGRALVFAVGLRYFYESAAPETGSTF